MAEGSISRRKSCSECVKAKRKCGMEIPTCNRCSKKSLACLYSNKRKSISNLSIPELEFPWLDDLVQESGVLPWSGELQSQVPINTTVPSYLLDNITDEPARTTLERSETEAAVHRFKSWPDKWLKEGKAPFIHPQLYSSGMPKQLQEAYAACAIYSTKTPANSFVAFNIIEAKANELLGSRDCSVWTPLDLLAAIQSLLIFQFIRLFDGDIRQRALAESAEPVLEAWTTKLQTQTRIEQDFTTVTAPSWRSWVFAESVRRTITMSYFLSGIYSLVKRGYCTVSEQVTANSFTAQRALWEAPSELDWGRVKAKHNPLWVNKMELGHVLRDAKPSELDDFGMVMLITYNGKDVTDHWFAISDAALVGIPDFHQSLSDIVQFSELSGPSSDGTW